MTTTRFYDPKKDLITFGNGGVDDAEDLEVIWHEYGHAIQDDQVPGFGATHDANAIGEGFGDYWAFTMSEPVSGGFDPACIADWDSISYTVGDAVTACAASTSISRWTTRTARSTTTARSGRGRCSTSTTRSAARRPTRSSCRHSSASVWTPRSQRLPKRPLTQRSPSLAKERRSR